MGWKSEIKRELDPIILPAIGVLQQNNPEVGISKNYRLIFGNGLERNDITYIPIRVPYRNGALYIGDAAITTNADMDVIDIGVDWKEEAVEYTAEMAQEPDPLSELSTIFDVIKWTAVQTNSIVNGEAMRSLLRPNVVSSDFDIGGIFGDSRSPATQISSGGRQASVGSKRIRAGERFGSGSNRWGQVRSRNIAAEAERADSIKSEKDRRAFIEEALDKPQMSPLWYGVLGGKAKKRLKEKITESYLKKCDEVGETLRPTAYLENLTENMLKKGNLVPYCTDKQERIYGTATQCEQTNCPIYDPNCHFYGHRLAHTV